MVTLRGVGNVRRPMLVILSLCLVYYLFPGAIRLYSGDFVKQTAYKGRRDPPVLGCPGDDLRSPETALAHNKTRVKAAILLLARNEDLETLIPTLHNFEETFNAKFRYPYIFLNEAGLSATFQKGVRDALPETAAVEYGVIPHEHWSIPDWIDKEQVREGFVTMREEGVQYADKESYHHMCRYYSGLFALHPILLKYDYYWRLEPGVRFFSELQYDPFLYMAQHNKVYGWVITIVETLNTIPSLFDKVLEWRNQAEQSNSAWSKFGDKLRLADWQGNNELWEFFLENPERRLDGTLKNKENYNLCHFWTNFELGDLRFFRSKEYRSLFNHLDQSGGFYTERWGDAPIRSLALGLLAGFDKVHYFEDIIYKHDWFMHVPTDQNIGCKRKPPQWEEWTRDIDNDAWYSCLPRWRALDTA